MAFMRGQCLGCCFYEGSVFRESVSFEVSVFGVMAFCEGLVSLMWRMC